jgi:D-xylulose reductase
VFDLVCPGGRVVFIGMPGGPISYDVVAAQIKEARVEHIFRYAHVYPRALALMDSGRIDVKPMITDRFPFVRGIEAFEFARHMPPTSVKVQIELEE